MKVIIPTNISEIKLKQFQELSEVVNRDGITKEEINKEKVKIFTDIDLDKVTIPQSDYEDLISTIDKALDTPAEFKPKFKMQGIEFGFHPNLDKMSTAEYKDLVFYNDTPKTLHYLMAILFRPIKTKDSFDNYTIEEYTGTDKYRELMKDIPLSVVNGALFFFRNLSRELLKSIRRYSTPKELKKGKKHQIFGKSGNGTAHLSNLQTTI